MFLSWEAVALNLLPAGLTAAPLPPDALPDPAIIMEAAYHPPGAAAVAAAAAGPALDGAADLALAAQALAAPAGGAGAELPLGALNAAAAAAAVAAEAPLPADAVADPGQILGGLAVDPLQARAGRAPGRPAAV